MPDEATHADSIRYHLTGADSDGGAQTDPDASLGKYRSSTEVEALGAQLTNPIANITIDHVSAACGTGVGSLEAVSVDEVKFTPPDGTQGEAVTIANGETKIVEAGGDEPTKYVRITRTSADDLAGEATITLTDVFNNAIGFDNVTVDEGAAGDVEYRCVCVKNDGSFAALDIGYWIAVLGTQETSDIAQLSASGAGTIQVSGDFDDWPDSGFVHIREADGTQREIAYYTERTSNELTIPAVGRGLLGTSAAAGASDDTLDVVPGLRIAKEDPSAQPDGYATDKTVAGEGSPPSGLTWRTGLTAATGVDIGTLEAGYIMYLWFERTVVAGATAEASVLNHIQGTFDAV